MLEKNSELRERYLKFSQEEKIHLFDEIQKNYFEKNRGSVSHFPVLSVIYSRAAFYSDATYRRIPKQYFLFP